MSDTKKKVKKKRLRGFAGVIQNFLEPLNENEYFQDKFEDEEFKIMLNATDGRYAALITVEDGELDVEGLKNKPREDLKKKELGWDGKLETKMEIFLDIAMGKLSTWDIIKKVLGRKIKLRGPRKLLKLLKMFNILSYEKEKEEEPKE